VDEVKNSSDPHHGNLLAKSPALGVDAVYLFGSRVFTGWHNRKDLRNDENQIIYEIAVLYRIVQFILYTAGFCLSIIYQTILPFFFGHFFGTLAGHFLRFVLVVKSEDQAAITPP